MVHGFRGTHHGLAKIVEQLPDFYIIVPDLPGFGASSPLTDEHSVEHYVRFVAEFITALKLQKPIVVGHSFGSIVTSHFAATHPDMLTKLVLINPIAAPALQGPRGVMTHLTALYYWIGHKLPTSAARKWLSMPLIVRVMSITMTKTNDKDLQRYIHDQHRRHFSAFADPTVVVESFKASATSDVSHVAADLTIPTLLIAGTKDDVTAIDKQRDLHRHIAASELCVIDNVGHLIHYEKAAEAATMIKDFIVKK